MVTDPRTGEPGAQEAAVVGLALDDGTVLAGRVMSIPSAGLVAVADDLVVADRAGTVLTGRRVDAGTWNPVWTSQVELVPRTTDGRLDAHLEVDGDVVVVVRGPVVAVLRASDGTEVARWAPVVEPLVRTMEAAEVVAGPTGSWSWSGAGR